MDSLSSHFIPFFICLILYFLSSIGYGLAFVLRKKIVLKMAFYFAWLGFLIHCFILGLEFYYQSYPLVLTFFHIYQLIALALFFSLMMLSRLYRLELLGVVIIPLVLIVYLISLTRLVTLNTSVELLMNAWGSVHIYLMSLTLIIFITSFILGVLYLKQNKALKGKNINLLDGDLPSLEILVQSHDRGLFLGFGIFTLGIISGSLWSYSQTGNFIHLDFKMIFAFVLWFFFLILIKLKVSEKFFGLKGILLSMIGILATLILFYSASGF